MKKVVFLCGMSGGERDEFILKKILSNFEVLYFPYHTMLKESFENLASQLGNFIGRLKLKKNEKVSIVGLSAGGIIADYYLKFIDNSHVDKFAVICSPFKGTYLSKFFPKWMKGIRQLDPSSDFISKINSKKLKNVKIISFWSILDPIVPRRSGEYVNAIHTWFFLHWIVQFWPPILYQIRDFLED